MNRRTLVHGALWLTAFLVVTEWAGKLLISAGQVRRDHDSAQKNWDRLFRQLRQPDPELGYYLASTPAVSVVGPQFEFSVELTDVGVGVPLRDDGIDRDRGQRWLVLGDEAVWGHGVNGAETFCERLESLEPDRDVINAGMPGYTPLQYTRLLTRLLDAGLEVDTVLFVFNGSDDCRAEYDFREWSRISATNPSLAGPEAFRTAWVRADFQAAEDERLAVQTEGRGFLSTYAERWLALSQFTVWADPSVETELSFDPVPAEGVSPPGTIVPLLLTCQSHAGPITEFSAERVNHSAGYPLCDLPEDALTMYRVNFPLVEDSMVQAAAVCEERGLRFVAVYLPSKEMVNADLVVRRVKPSARSRVAAMMHRVREHFAEVCVGHELEGVDPTPDAVRRDYSGVNLFHRFSGDWNRDGHQLVADVVHREVK